MGKADVAELTAKLNTLSVSELSELIDTAQELQQDLEDHPEKQLTAEELGSLAEELKALQSIEVTIPCKLEFSLTAKLKLTDVSHSDLPWHDGLDRTVSIKPVGKTNTINNIESVVVEPEEMFNDILETKVKSIPALGTLAKQVKDFSLKIRATAEKLEIDDRTMLDIVESHINKRRKKAK